MDLIWVVALIAGCVAMAMCIALVLLRPMDAERRQLRPIANAGRLTSLPEYVRARRARTRATVVTIALLVVMFACSVVVAARPSGLPTSARQFDRADPEDIMLCVGAPVADPAVGAALRYFADQMDGFGTQRIGLTSPNRRVVPLTRDYQYAKATFSAYAQSADQPGDVGAFTPNVSYVDYTESVDDLLALCLTGFPEFDRKVAQRRSLIYVGPDQLRSTDDRRPSLFSGDQSRDLARTAGVQVNAVVTGQDSGTLSSLTRDTGGRSLPAGSSVATALEGIRDHPPAIRLSEGSDGSPALESPDVPALIALAAAAALAGWPLVRRR